MHYGRRFRCHDLLGVDRGLGVLLLSYTAAKLNPPGFCFVDANRNGTISTPSVSIFPNPIRRAGILRLSRFYTEGKMPRISQLAG